MSYKIFKNRRILFISIISIILFFLEMYVAMHSNGRHPRRFTIMMASLPILFFSCGRIASVCWNTAFITLLIFSIYLSYICQFVSDNTLDAIMGTNWHEAASMLRTVPWVAYFIAILILSMVTMLSWRLGRWKPRMAIIALVPLAMTGAGNIWTVYATWPFRTASWTADGALSYIASTLRQCEPGVVGNITYITILASERMIGRNWLVRPHTVIDPQVIGRHLGRVHNIIFVMGESSLATRYGVYGYKDQNTTPNLMEMKEKNQVCIIRNTHSNANLTRYSVPMTFSFQTPENHGNLFQEKNIIEMARDNGYKAFWIASQDGTGPYARPFGYLSEYSNYTTRQDYNNEKNGVNWKDDSILPVIKDKMKDSAPYKIYIVHIMGSHQAYDDKITPADVNALPNADSYDQSIHHTDNILKAITNMATSELGDYALIYTSDHGEVMGLGHGYQYGGYDQYVIPMIIHDTNGVGNYCDMAEKMRNHDGYYTSIMNKYILLNMLGYDIDPVAIEAERSKDKVLHSDSKVYDYINLPKPQDKQKYKGVLPSGFDHK